MVHNIESGHESVGEIQRRGSEWNRVPECMTMSDVYDENATGI